MLCVKIGISQVPVDLCVRPRHAESNSGKHVVCCHPIDMVLVDFGANDHTFVILVSFPFACSLLLDMLGPARGIIVLRDLIEMCI